MGKNKKKVRRRRKRNNNTIISVCRWRLHIRDQNLGHECWCISPCEALLIIVLPETQTRQKGSGPQRQGVAKSGIRLVNYVSCIF